MRHLLSADALILSVLLAFGSTGGDAEAPDTSSPSAVPAQVEETAAEEDEGAGDPAAEPPTPADLEAMLDADTPVLAVGTELSVESLGEHAIEELLPVEVYTDVFDADPRKRDFVGLFTVGKLEVDGGPVWIVHEVNWTHDNDHTLIHLTRDPSAGWRQTEIGTTRGYHCDTSIDTTITVADDGILEVTTTTTPPDCDDEVEPEPPTVERFRMQPDGRKEALSGE